MYIHIRRIFRNLKYILIYFKFRVNQYKIGYKFVIGKKSSIEKEGFWAGYNVYIGPYSYISNNTKIGHFSMLSDHINIIGSDHVFNKIGTPIILAGRPKNQPMTIIENDVWIGHAVTIMRGVKIGEGSIIGANSVVTKDIEPYTINIGNPVKFLKYRFSSKQDVYQHKDSLNSKIQNLTDIEKGLL